MECCTTRAWCHGAVQRRVRALRIINTESDELHKKFLQARRPVCTSGSRPLSVPPQTQSSCARLGGRAAGTTRSCTRATRQEANELEQAFLVQCAPLFADRLAIIKGDREPTGEELDGADPSQVGLIRVRVLTV